VYSGRLELLNDTFLGANSLTQHMLPQLFATGMPFVNSMIARVRDNLDAALSTFSHHRCLRARAPDGGYYLFPAVDGWDDEEALALHLLDHGVLAHPGFYYGDVSGAHLMISALTEPAAFREGVARIAAALGA